MPSNFVTVPGTLVILIRKEIDQSDHIRQDIDDRCHPTLIRHPHLSYSTSTQCAVILSPEMSGVNVVGSSLKYRNLLVVIKQTAFEEYSQLKLRGQAPKALRWKRLEQRYKAHKKCVNDLLGVLRKQEVAFSCVNRVELDRQHLADIDLMVAVGGDGTVLSAAHFLDHGTLPLLGVNSDPNVSLEDRKITKKADERRYEN